MGETLKVKPLLLHPRPTVRIYVRDLAQRARDYLARERSMLGWLTNHPIIFTLVLTLAGTTCFVRMIVGPSGVMPSAGYVVWAWVWSLSVIAFIAVTLGACFLLFYYIPDGLILYDRLRASWHRWLDRS